VDSGLQTFPPSGVQGKISGGTLPPSDADDSFSRPAGGSSSGSDEPQASGWLHKFTVAAYKPYFDVDTTDVLDRLKESLYPFRGTFTEKTATNPDLYGPFWICTTLIFVAASIGTFVTYVAHKLRDKEWNYDINLVTWSAGVFYGYVTVVPLVLYVILGYMVCWCVLWLCHCRSSCLVCYSQVLLSTSRPCPTVLSIWILIIYLYSSTAKNFVCTWLQCLSVVPLEIFRWIIAAVAGFMSATFVALNLKAHITSAGERWVLIVAGIFLLQLGLAVVLKLYLFTVSV
ncbi:hypothetical protein Gohar_013969, partial [Gossypium harknessii]|nr:hypothetical protein [Gossypium harknessii]